MPKYNQNVFVNCPFDNDYQSKFDAIIFTVFECGFIPISAKDENNCGEVRIEKIFKLIEKCRFSIHDISRVELNTEGLPRFNMPLELGIFLGAQKYGIGKQNQKSALIVDSEEYRYQSFISDIAGQDIKTHHNDHETLIMLTRNYLSPHTSTRISGATKIIERYEQFQQDLPSLMETFGLSYNDVTHDDYIQMIGDWQISNTP